VGGWALEGRRHGHGHLGDWVALVLRSLGILIAFGRFMTGSTCALLGRNRLWVVARLFFYIAPTLGTSHRRIATVCSLLHYTSVARLVGGLPNPHPRWVGSQPLLGSSPSFRPGFTGVVCLGTHYFRFHFILLTRLNKALTWLHRCFSLYSLPFPE